jgi:hypothetical protein
MTQPDLEANWAAQAWLAFGVFSVIFALTHWMGDRAVGFKQLGTHKGQLR